MPHDGPSDERTDGVSAKIVRLPAQKKSRPSKKGGGRGRTPAVHPGPPPPLPADLLGDDLVIPPKPPLPPLPPTGDTAVEDAPAAVEDEAVAEADIEDAIVEDADIESPAIDDEVVEAEDDVVEDAAVDPVAVEETPVDEATVGDDLIAEEAIADEPPSEQAVDEASTADEVVAEGEAVAEDEVVAADALAFAAAPPAVATDVLVLRGVTKSFGATRAVDAVDLTVPAGTFYGLVGPNGAGKTTTLSMIAGLLTPDRGSVTVGGIDAASDPRAVKRLIGVLPDRLRTFDRLTGRQLLHYYGTLRGLRPAIVESRTADLARAFDLTDALGRVVSDYSAGMLKKVMLAGALIHSPRLLVLDEPFESVDPVSSAIILDILKTYVSHGGTVILSSHGMDLVESVCTRVAVVVAGQVLAEGPVDEVRGELTLEQRFVELAGGLSDVEGLEWLHTFSG